MMQLYQKLNFLQSRIKACQLWLETEFTIRNRSGSQLDWSKWNFILAPKVSRYLISPLYPWNQHTSRMCPCSLMSMTVVPTLCGSCGCSGTTPHSPSPLELMRKWSVPFVHPLFWMFYVIWHGLWRGRSNICRRWLINSLGRTTT